MSTSVLKVWYASEWSPLWHMNEAQNVACLVSHLHCFPCLTVHPGIRRASSLGTQQASTASHSSGRPQSHSSPSSTILLPQYEPLFCAIKIFHEEAQLSSFETEHVRTRLELSFCSHWTFFNNINLFFCYNKSECKSRTYQKRLSHRRAKK